MFGVALRLLAAGRTSRRLGDYVKNLMARFIVLERGWDGAVPGSGSVRDFGRLLGDELSDAKPDLVSSDHDGDLLFAALAIALTAYGITREKPRKR